MTPSYAPPWLALKEVLTSSETSFIIASPFISSCGLAFLDQHLPASVSLTIFSQFTPENIHSGYLDVSALSLLLNRRGNVSFYHCSRLHAKIYSNHTSALVGSFNLTGRGLGLVHDYNFEAYSLLARVDPYVDLLMRAIEEESDVVTPLLMSALLRADGDRRDTLNSFSVVTSSAYWFPSYRRPHLLYRYYSTRNFSPSSSAASDLRTLMPPQGLTEEEFNQYIRFSILRYPLLRSMIAAKTVSQLSLSQAFLNASIDHEEYGEVEQVYVTLYRWVLFFFPEFSGKADYYLEAE